MAQPKSSKQKRAAQNKASRQAQAARKVNASATPAASSSTSGPTKRRGFLGGLLNPTPPAKGAGSATATGASAARAAAIGTQPPGQRAVTVGLFAALAACLLIMFYPVSVDADGDLYSRESLAVTWTATAAEASIDAPDATPDELVESIDEWTPGRESKIALIAIFPLSLGTLLPPIGAVFALRAVRQRRSSKLITRTLFITLLGTMVSPQPTVFLPAVAGIGVAMYQVRKAEVAAASVAVGDPATGDVVEAQLVEDASESGDDAPK